MILQFMLIGAPSIYYGDEAEIDGWTQNNEGCRFPMPWDKDFRQTDTYYLYRTLAHLKQSTPALRRDEVPIYPRVNHRPARFDDREALVAVASGDDRDCAVPLAPGSVGAGLPENHADLFGEPPQARALDDHTVELRVPAEKSHLIRCPLK